MAEERLLFYQKYNIYTAEYELAYVVVPDNDKIFEDYREIIEDMIWDNEHAPQIKEAKPEDITSSFIYDEYENQMKKEIYHRKLKEMLSGYFWDKGLFDK